MNKVCMSLMRQINRRPTLKGIAIVDLHVVGPCFIPFAAAAAACNYILDSCLVACLQTLP